MLARLFYILRIMQQSWRESLEKSPRAPTNNRYIHILFSESTEPRVPSYTYRLETTWRILFYTRFRLENVNIPTAVADTLVWATRSDIPVQSFLRILAECTISGMFFCSKCPRRASMAVHVFSAVACFGLHGTASLEGKQKTTGSFQERITWSRDRPRNQKECYKHCFGGTRTHTRKNPTRERSSRFTSLRERKRRANRNGDRNFERFSYNVPRSVRFRNACSSM